jgi:serine/threonine-protein kinase
VRDKLGSGSTATVYRAFDPELEREVALKVPHAGSVSGAPARERFLNEARTLARLDHPRIVSVFDAGSDGGTPYLATSFIAGRTLASCLKEDGPFPPLQAAEIAAELADALSHAHGLGVVHRDVKPANVLVANGGSIHLTDFSLSRSDPPDVAAKGLLFGTPAYLAPEQTDENGAGADLAASDQYSLGVVLYEMLCGRPPFLGPPPLLLYYARHDEPIPPHDFRPGVPLALERICLKAMDRRPEGRYASCQALAGELRRWVKRARARQSAFGTVRRAAVWVRRRPAAALSSFLVVIGVVASTVLASALITSTALAPFSTVGRSADPHDRPVLITNHDRP